ncbi:MAG: hypothetical protein Kow00121_02770 [Elainellaceae cyanobacterium]
MVALVQQDNSTPHSVHFMISSSEIPTTQIQVPPEQTPEPSSYPNSTPEPDLEPGPQPNSEPVADEPDPEQTGLPPELDPRISS